MVERAEGSRCITFDVPRDYSHSELWRVHQQHRDHTPEKYEQHNSQANKNCLGKLVALLSVGAEWRSIGDVDRRFGFFYICSA